MDFDYIHSKNLKASDIPKDAKDWSSLVVFASTFNPLKERVSGNHVTGVEELSKNASVEDLRLAIYAEWRRYNHFGYPPTAVTLSQVQHVLDILRGRLSNT